MKWSHPSLLTRPLAGWLQFRLQLSWVYYCRLITTNNENQMQLKKDINKFIEKIKISTINKLGKYISYSYLLLSFIFVVSGLLVYLYSPSYKQIMIEGTEVKRSVYNKKSEHIPRDQYYINGMDQSIPFVLINKDTFFYFKWNSADIQATAQKLQRENKVVTIKYYGIRSNLFSIYPNIISFSENHQEYSITKIIFMLLHLILFIYLLIKIIKVHRYIKTQHVIAALP